MRYILLFFMGGLVLAILMVKPVAPKLQADIPQTPPELLPKKIAHEHTGIDQFRQKSISAKLQGSIVLDMGCQQPERREYATFHTSLPILARRAAVCMLLYFHMVLVGPRKLRNSSRKQRTEIKMMSYI